MESFEQTGELPEQRKNEPVKSEGKAPDRSASPESYNIEEWQRLKRGGAALAITKGKQIGVPREELDRFAEDVITRETTIQNYDFVYRFRKNMGIGTEKEVRAAGEQAYKFFLESEDSGSAMSIAEDVYGRDSEEWRRVHEANEAGWKKAAEKRQRKEKEAGDEERELTAAISKDATFVDLFNAIDAIEEKAGLGELHFYDELWDNFNSEVGEEVLALQSWESSKAATTKVLDFFRERGYSQKDVSIFLPIKFKRERKKK